MDLSEQSPPECPSCNRALMSRISPLCSWCGAKVPDGLRYSPEEIRRIEDEETAIRKEQDAKEEAIEKKKRKKVIIEGVIDLASLFIPTPQLRFWRPPDEHVNSSGDDVEEAILSFVYEALPPDAPMPDCELFPPTVPCSP